MADPTHFGRMDMSMKRHCFKTRHSLKFIGLGQGWRNFLRARVHPADNFHTNYFARGKLTLLGPYFRLFQWRLSALGALRSCPTGQWLILALMVVRISGPFRDILLEFSWEGVRKPQQISVKKDVFGWRIKFQIARTQSWNIQYKFRGWYVVCRQQQYRHLFKV